jgi:GMP synthase (glutamine-hydrolysing)
MPESHRSDGIVILDFGGQYCHLIARRVREMNVFSEILPCDATLDEIRALEAAMQVKGIILSGSPSSVRATDAPELADGVLELGLPFLGLCYGHQLIAHLYGGEVRRGERREYGVTEVTVDSPVGVLEGMNPVERVWMSHGDTVFSVPGCFDILAHTDASPVAAYRHGESPLFGLQWHPEVVHTERGREMLRNFVFHVCGCSPNWRPTNAVERAVDEIKEAVGGSKAIIALSGGVDSSVAAVLAARALGRRLTAVHVDHGFS